MEVFWKMAQMAARHDLCVLICKWSPNPLKSQHINCVSIIQVNQQHTWCIVAGHRLNQFWFYVSREPTDRCSSSFCKVIVVSKGTMNFCFPWPPPHHQCVINMTFLCVHWTALQSTWCQILGADECNSQKSQCHSSVTTYSCFYCFRFIPIYRGPSHTYKIQRLTESTCYSFRIQAVNDAGEGPFSEISTFCTTKSVPPAIKGM